MKHVCSKTCNQARMATGDGLLFSSAAVCDLYLHIPAQETDHGRLDAATAGSELLFGLRMLSI